MKLRGPLVRRLSSEPRSSTEQERTQEFRHFQAVLDAQRIVGTGGEHVIDIGGGDGKIMHACFRLAELAAYSRFG